MYTLREVNPQKAKGYSRDFKKAASPEIRKKAVLEITAVEMFAYNILGLLLALCCKNKTHLYLNVFLHKSIVTQEKEKREKRRVV